MKLKKHLALVAALALTMVSGLSAQTGVSTRVGNGVEVGEPVPPGRDLSLPGGIGDRGLEARTPIEALTRPICR